MPAFVVPSASSVEAADCLLRRVGRSCSARCCSRSSTRLCWHSCHTRSGMVTEGSDDVEVDADGPIVLLLLAYSWCCILNSGICKKSKPSSSSPSKEALKPDFNSATDNRKPGQYQNLQYESRARWQAIP